MKRTLLFLSALGAAFGLAFFCADHEWHPLAAGATADHVLVEKAARRLTLFQGSKLLKTYRIALGRSPAGQKEREGDQRTPEGMYRIDYHNPDSACYRALHVSYPNAGDLGRARRQGMAPGGDIMIHGVRNGLGWLGAFHRCLDWTNGCIAVTDAQMDEIYRSVPNGTPVEIRP